jgi:hypothetical protein
LYNTVQFLFKFANLLIPMLKKITHIVFGLLLIVATSGFTISKHYCGNQLFSVSILHAKVCNCGDKCKDCHTDIIQVKVYDDFAAPDVLHPEAPTTSDLFIISNIDFSTFTFPAITTAYYLLKAPPPGNQNTFALLQSFRC